MAHGCTVFRAIVGTLDEHTHARTNAHKHTQTHTHTNAQVGEHDHCGPGNLPKSGFSYDPESFMAAKIGFFNFSWQDMGVPDLDRMMDIVQVCVCVCF